MRTILVLLPVLALAGCIAGEVRPEVEATRDLIALEQPPQVDTIRVLTEMHYSYLNDYYVWVNEGSRNYLVEFESRCWALRRNQYSHTMVDRRRDPSYLHAKWDTLRGCPIDRIYKVTDAQLSELVELHTGTPLASGR